MSRQRYRTLMPRHGGIHIIYRIHIHIPLVAPPCMKTFTQVRVAHPYDHRTARPYTISSINTIIISLIKSINYLIHNRNCIRNKQHHRIKALPPIPHSRNHNPTRWHQVKHKSWRRRRRANHLAVFNRSRPVSFFLLLLTLFNILHLFHFFLFVICKTRKL